jgi:hypothetical protein
MAVTPGIGFPILFKECLSPKINPANRPAAGAGEFMDKNASPGGSRAAALPVGATPPVSRRRIAQADRDYRRPSSKITLYGSQIKARIPATIMLPSTRDSRNRLDSRLSRR